MAVARAAHGLTNGAMYIMVVAIDKAPPSSTLSLTDLRGNLREVVDEVVRTGGEVIITRHGQPVAVLLAHDEYESLIETVNILSDDETMAAIAESEADFAAGNFLRIDSSAVVMVQRSGVKLGVETCDRPADRPVS